MNAHKHKLAILALVVMASVVISCGSGEPQTASPTRAATGTSLQHITPPAQSLPTLTATIVQTPTPAQSPTGIPATAQAGPSTAPPTALGCTPTTDWVDYTVQVDDTLSLLASKTNISVDLLMQANCLSSDLIFAGQTLHLPFIPPAPPAATMTSSLVPTGGPTSSGAPTPEIPGAPSPTPEIPGAPSPTIERPDAPGPGDPHVAVSPSSGPAGTSFTISIEHFAANEAVTVRIIFVDTFEIVSTIPATVRAEGSVTVDYGSLRDSKIGTYVVDVVGETSHASGEFTIVAPTPTHEGE